MGKGDRIYINGEIRVFGDSGSAGSSVNAAGYLYDDWAGGESGTPHINTDYSQTASAIPIWFMPDWGGTGYHIGWINKNHNNNNALTPPTSITFSGTGVSGDKAPPDTNVTISWSGARVPPLIADRTNNGISGYRIYNGNTLLTTVSTTNTYGSYTIPSGSFTNTRGASATFHIDVFWSKSRRTHRSSKTLYIKNSIKFTFNSNGGSTASPASITRDEGTAVGTLPTTSRTGYTFNGWYTSTSGGTKLTTSTAMNTSRTYYAQWTINRYTVTFKNYDGVTLKTETVNYGANASPPTSPSRTGYTFSGWSGTYTNITSSRTITATYKINTYTVSFNDYDGTRLKTQTVNHGSNASPPTNPSRAGYTFSGWSGTYTNITSSRTITAVYIRKTTRPYVLINGSARETVAGWVKVDGVLRPISVISVNVNGVIKTSEW